MLDHDDVPGPISDRRSDPTPGAADRPRARRVSARMVRTAALVTAGAALLAACSSSASGGGTGSSTSSATGGTNSFYKGKTITYILGSSPGTPTADQIVDMQPALQKYLGAKINIRYVTGQSATGYDQTASAKADGLTIGEISPQVVYADIYSGGSGKGGITFDPTKLTYINSVGNAPLLLVACKGSPIKSMADLVSSTKKVSWVEPAVGSSLEFAHLMMTAYPVSHSYLTGYQTATAVQGCERGDGSVSAVPVTNWTNAAGDGLVSGVTPLMLSGEVVPKAPAAFLNSKVPTLSAYMKTNPTKTAQGPRALDLVLASMTSDIPEIATVGPSGMPAEATKELVAAFKYAVSQPDVQKELAKDSLGATYIGADVVEKYFTSAGPQTKEIATYTK